MTLNKTFREWFSTDYLMQAPHSSLLMSNNSFINDRKERICQVAEKILKSTSNPNISEIREEVAIEFFVSMRCALDYITFALLLINIYNKSKNRKV
jgi:hypothetical protein